jgi:hypothetical protein
MNGGEYEYPGIPNWKVQGLLHARSHGAYFHQNIATSSSRPLSSQSNRHETADVVIARSIENLAAWCDRESLSFVKEQLNKTPCLVVPVSNRKTKHGDHTPRAAGDFSKLTVNASGNRYQFLITLLHELCHASVYYQHGGGTPPHGSIWKNTFSGLLSDAIDADLFPPDIRSFVKAHSEAPKSSSSLDIGLQIALRAYDTQDCRPTLAELPLGTPCSVDGQAELIRAEFSNSWIICRTPEGGTKKFSPLTRVRHPSVKPDPETMHDIDIAFCELTMDAFANRGDRQRRAVLEHIQKYWNRALHSNPTDKSPLNGSEHWFERMVRTVETKAEGRLVEKMQLLKELSENVVEMKCLKEIETQRWIESRMSCQQSR